jgi:shikimate kinase
LTLRLALAGPMAVGKSSVGQRVAARLGVSFRDLDEEIGEAEALFRQGGEACFRAREAAVLAELARGQGVLALGGGTLTSADNRTCLVPWRIVVLMARPETLARRLGDGAGRPLAHRWRQLLDERTPTWLSYGAPVHVDELDVEAVAEQVLARC